MGILFYVIMLIWFVFGLWWSWPREQSPQGYGMIGGNLMLFILLLLLGWKVFGPPLQ
jgi:hypothetical protein